MTASPNFWRGKQVLLTGHTGFKGAWLALWLCQMGAKVTGISLPPNSMPNLFTLANIAQMTNSHSADIRDADAVSNIVTKVQPEIVLHLAAQALVRHGYKDPLGTFATNVMGTANVLNAVRGVNSVKALVAVTTDKVYKNLETGRAYKEDDQLGGFDPYSASKAASELIIASYRDSYLSEQGIAVASARAGNVIGGGDWSEDRLIPDAVRAWDSDLPLEIRRPNAIRPWQHVLEPLNGYLVLAEKIYTDSSLAGAFNFGPQAHEAATVQKVIELANRLYGCGSVLWGDGTAGPHEAGLLSLEISKAQEILDVTPRWNLLETMERTMGWYQQQRSGVNADLLCDADIAAFSSAQKV
ncbi:CDP-glucose 4,6-dehydratase [Polynucleobacter paneuropaeus]|nr:CDP-glucose 4,6-dehydratase [Polynucleobacter paneuropaeus]